MSVSINVAVGTVADTAPKPATFQDLLTLIAQNLTYTLTNSQNAVEILIGVGASINVTGIDTAGMLPPIAPESVPEGTIYAMTDAAGRPVSLNVVKNGQWVFFDQNPIYRLKYFIGYPAYYFDSTGKGVYATQWYGWALANGKNGTGDYVTKFLVPGYKGDGNGWIANITAPPAAGTSLLQTTSTFLTGDAYEGGLAYAVIGPGNLPALTIGVDNEPNYTVGSGPQNFVAGAAGTEFNEKNPGTTSLYVDQLTPSHTYEAFFILPPYMAIGVCEFIGY